jgi:hypothetical protein
MIRKRRPRRGKLHEYRREIILVLAGAIIAAAVAGGLPSACSTLIPSDEEVIDQIQRELDQRQGSRR